MADIKFDLIGYGWKQQTKSGKDAIKISLDPAQLDLMHDEDYKKIFMFSNQYKKDSHSPDFFIRAAIPVKDNAEDEKTIEEVEEEFIEDLKENGKPIPF